MSLFLTICLLLSTFTVFATTASAADAASVTTSESSAVSYLDLYVKDGLVAIFDGYSVEASDTAPTEWKPVDFYGKAGYDSYLDTTSYTYAFDFVGNTAAMKQVDGGYQMQIKGSKLSWGHGAYLNLDSLGALLGVDGVVTIQEVTSHAVASPVVENGVVTNYTSLDKGLTNFRGLISLFGSFEFGGSQLTGSGLDGYSKIVGIVVEQMQFKGKYIGHITYSTEAYGCVTYSTLKGNDNTELAGYTVGKPVTVERTISRFPYTEELKTDENGLPYTQYTSEYTFNYLAVPKQRSGCPVTVDGFTYSSADKDAHASTALHLAADGALSRSVRIYNRELTLAEVSRNHFADLCAFYGLASDKIAEVLAFDKYQSKALYSMTDAMQLVAVKDTASGSEYMLAKAAFEDAIATAKGETVGETADYVKLYVSDGLVALFDAYSETASDKAVTAWAPEALDMVEGYVDYIDPTTYSYPLVGTWHAIDGGLKPENTGSPSLYLNSLGALLGTRYTVQEVFSYELITPKIENGVFLNDSEYEYFGAYNAAAVGPLLYGPLNSPKIAANLTGYSTPLHNVLFEQLCFGTTTKYDYVTHAYFLTPAYGGNFYTSLEGAGGYNFSGYTIGGGLTIIERSIARLGVTVTEEDGVQNYTSHFNVHYQHAPFLRGAGALTDKSISQSKQPTNKDVHYSTTLRVGASDATYHSIRIYNRELTASEYNQNHLVDLAAYAGMSLEAYTALDAQARAMVADLMSAIPLTKDRLALSIKLNELISFTQGAGTDASTSLYVTRGLTVLLSSYEGFSTSYSQTAENITVWSNAVDPSTYGVLQGTGWTKNATGGFTLVKTLADYAGTRPEDIPAGKYADYSSKEAYGLTFDGSLLPSADFTVELVANPVGITNEDGTRFIDSYSRYGTWIENGMAIGPLRAMQFSCYRPSGYDGQMHRRWNYATGDSPYISSNAQAILVDTYWQALDLKEIVTFTVMMEVTSASHNYTIAQDNYSAYVAIPNEKVITNEEANNMFRLMHGVAGTIYSVRVYNRALTKAEQAQNHMADLVYYYGIDAGLVAEVLSASGGALESLTDAFADLDFTIDRRMAQEIFNERLTAVWLSAEGYAIRGDMTDGLRYYFNINETALAAVALSGLTAEIGAVVNVKKNALPTLDDYGYDYKVVAFDTVMGREDKLFIDDDTFAVTVRYENAQKENLIGSITVLGYVKLTDADGNQTVYYTRLTDDTPNSLFESYYLMEKAENSQLLENSALAGYVNGKIAASYSDAYIYLDASAAAGGNGTVDAPYADFATAFAASKEFLRGVTVPTNLYLTLADGRYSITETQTLNAEDKPYNYSIFAITSESGNAVLTSTVDLDTGKFVFEGDNIYSYQFEADENGNYPEFRMLYVNDGLAEIATSGSSRAADREDLYVTAFDRIFNGVAYMAEQLRTEAGYDFDYMPENYQGRGDLEEEFAYYRDHYIALNDVEAIAKSDSSKLAYKMARTRSNGSTVYNTAFDSFVIQFMAAYDVRQIVKNEGLTNLKTTYFKELAPRKVKADFGGNEADFKLYTDAFNAARNAMYSANNGALFYDAFTVELRDDMRHRGKLYMPEDMVGDLTDLVMAGSEYMKEYAEKQILELTALIETRTEEYNEVRAEYLAVLAAVSALEEMKAYVNDGFSAALDAKIANVEAALTTAADSEKPILLAQLDAYKTLKESLGADPLKSIELLLPDFDKELADAVDKLTVAANKLDEAKQNLKKANTTKENVNDPDLWVRYALTPYMIELHHTCQWNYNIVHLTGVDYTDYVEVVTDAGVEKHIAIYMNMDEYNYFSINTGYSTADRYVHMKNAYGYLDENNEYFYDVTVGKLYYYSDTDISDFDFERATLDNVFIFRNVEGLTFDNVQFTGTDDLHLSEFGYTGGLSGMSSRYTNLMGLKNSFQDRAALYLENCSGVTIQSCRFYDLACEGVNVTGWSVDYVVDSNSFENIGSAALRMGLHTTGHSDGHGSSWFEGIAGNRNVTVTNNYFGNIATEYYVPALMITKLEDGVISHNTITDCSYTAISVGWDWGINYSDSFDHENKVNCRNVDISYNYITNFMTEMGDGGAIYMPVWNGAENNTDFYMNTVHHNYILFSKTTGDGMGKMVVGIYFDASTSNWYCYENVVVEQSYGAVSTETEYDAYGVDEEEAKLKELRRKGSYYIYLQHIDDQETYNILVQNNYILNVRSEEAAAQHTEVYKNYFSVKDAVEGRNLIESGTVYVVGLRGVPYEAMDIVSSAGCEDYLGDPSLIYTNNY